MGGALLASACFVQGVAAKEFKCDFVEKGSTGWVPKVVYLSDEAGEILVFDPIIKHFIGEPVTGRIQRENKRVVSYEWTLDQTTNSGGQYVTAFDYRILMQKSSAKATLTAVPLGYDSTYHADGTCAELKG
ncbi:hypothetical protein [Phaeovulum sp. W22_SRMD_FR3]|uniref:hypothetical protein n=1 Tax=Phaeovulum sp. W22_SRMD_FR3 TaxID=3240274 RepID=UPI003F9807B3